MCLTPALSNIACISCGVASVARSISLGDLPKARSLTAPPTMRISCLLFLNMLSNFLSSSVISNFFFNSSCSSSKRSLPFCSVFCHQLNGSCLLFLLATDILDFLTGGAFFPPQLIICPSVPGLFVEGIFSTAISSTGNSLLGVLKSALRITVFAIKSNSLFSSSHLSTNGKFISVCKSFITACASGPICAIGLPQRLYSCLNNLVNSLIVIGFWLRTSFTRSIKCRVNSTSIPTLPNSLSANFSSCCISTFCIGEASSLR